MNFLSKSWLLHKRLLKRIQIQILGAYYITINHEQGQMLKYAGLYLQNSLFTHGQLYVAL